jgi:hypothetical protein
MRMNLLARLKKLDACFAPNQPPPTFRYGWLTPLPEEYRRAPHRGDHEAAGEFARGTVGVRGTPRARTRRTLGWQLHCFLDAVKEAGRCN